MWKTACWTAFFAAITGLVVGLGYLMYVPSTSASASPAITISSTQALPTSLPLVAPPSAADDETATRSSAAPSASPVFPVPIPVDSTTALTATTSHTVTSATSGAATSPYGSQSTPHRTALVPTTCKCVALTLDDGPSIWTHRVTAVLRANHINVVRCVIGEQVAGYKQTLQAELAAGDKLCDHTWDHDERIANRPISVAASDIQRGRRAIIAATGIAPSYYRAPGGDWSTATRAYARSYGMTPLGWTIDTNDWRRPGVASIVHTVESQLRPGAIILMHDGGGNRSQTVAALKIIIPWAKAHGYQFVLPTP